MAPNVVRRSSRRPKAAQGVYMACPIPLKKSRRMDVDEIEGITVYSFKDELQLEYFANLEEPLPRKQKAFRGFVDADDSVNLIKHYFDRFLENFLEQPAAAWGRKPSVQLSKKLTPKKIKPRVSNKKKSKKQRTKTACSLPKTLLNDVIYSGENVDDVDEKIVLAQSNGDTLNFVGKDEGLDGADSNAVNNMTINVEESTDVCEPTKLIANKKESEKQQPKVSSSLPNTPLNVLNNTGHNIDDEDEKTELSQNNKDTYTGIVDRKDIGVEGADDSAVHNMTINVEESTDGFDSVEIVDVPVKAADEPIEIITISDNESDDDCVLVSDATTPIPRPVTPYRPCCRNCGKKKNTVRRCEPEKDSALGDELIITIDGDGSLSVTNGCTTGDRSSHGSHSQCKYGSPRTETQVLAEPDRVPAIPKQCLASKSLAPSWNPNMKPSQAATTWSLASVPPTLVSMKSSVPNKSQHSPGILQNQRNDLAGFPQKTIVESVTSFISPINNVRYRTAESSDCPSMSAVSTAAMTPVTPLANIRAIPTTQRQELSYRHPNPSEAATPTKILERSSLKQKSTPNWVLDESVKLSVNESIDLVTSQREMFASSENLLSPVEIRPAENLIALEPHKAEPKTTHTKHTLVKPMASSTPVIGSVKVCSESGKTVVLKLDGAKSKILKPLHHPLAESPMPLKMYCKPTKHRNIFQLLQDGRMNPSKSNPVVPNVPNEFHSRAPQPSDGNDVQSWRREMVLPKIASSSLVYRMNAPNITVNTANKASLTGNFEKSYGGNGQKAIASQSYPGAKRFQILRTMGDSKSLLKGGNSCLPIRHPVSDLKASKDRSDVGSTSSKTDVSQVGIGCQVLKLLRAPGSSLPGLSGVLPLVPAVGNKKFTSNLILVVDDVVKSIVRDMVDFVCRNETFSGTVVYDSPRVPEKQCLTIPCRKEHCVLGCVCVSLSKKSFRRARCKNIDCVFQCNCELKNGGAVQNRCMPRPKRIHGSVDEVPRSSASLSKAAKVNKQLLQAPKLTNAFPKPATQDCPRMPPQVTRAELPASSPRRYFGREKVPIPEQALICLTPGVGYVPIEEVTSTKVTVRDPFGSGQPRGFLNVRQAAEWLNSSIRHILAHPGPNLRWVVANKTMIENKQLHRLNIETLKGRKYAFSQNGAIRTQ